MIAVIGSSNTDMVIRTPRFCKPGETLMGGEFFMFPGGKGANQAVAAARLGSEVLFVAKVGNDIFGTNSIDGYRREGINVEHVMVDGTAPSGVALITVNEQGENTIVVAPGANHRITEADIDHIWPAISQVSTILVQLEIPLDVVEYIVRFAKRLSINVILNPAPAHALSAEIMSGLFAISPNESEAGLLTGIAIHDAQSAAEAALAMRASGVQNVLITMGANGVYVHTNEFTGVIAAPVVTPIDTTAAGDVFNGALAVALERGYSWQKAADFACRAAALSVTRMGAQVSAPFSHEITG